MRGYRRIDGLFDIEAHLVDTKTHKLTLENGHIVSPGEPVHDMSIRLVVDASLNVIDVVAVTDAAPFAACPEATATLQSLKGLRIGAGWSMAIRERLSGRNGCTHLTELLKPLGTAAFQTLAPIRLSQPVAVDASGKPRKIDSCYAYASDREIVRRRWPIHFDGAAKGE